MWCQETQSCRVCVCVCVYVRVFEATVAAMVEWLVNLFCVHMCVFDCAMQKHPVLSPPPP